MRFLSLRCTALHCVALRCVAAVFRVHLELNLVQEDAHTLLFSAFDKVIFFLLEFFACTSVRTCHRCVAVGLRI